MVTRKRSTKKAPVKTSSTKTAPIEKTVEFSPDRRLTVIVGTAADYGKAKVGLSLSENVKNDDDAMKLADAIFETLSDKLLEKFDALADKLGLDEEYDDEEGDTPDNKDEEEDEEWEDEEDDSEEDDSEDEEDDSEDEDSEEEEDDLTEEDVMKMKKSELVELIEDEELDIDIKGMKIKEIRESVVEAIFEDEEDGDENEDEDEEWDDEEWDDEEDE